METMTVHDLATQLSEAFQTCKRDNGNEFVILKDGSPQWMTEVCHKVHGDKLPDDTTYDFISRCASAIADADADTDDWNEVIWSIEADIYTSDLTGWLHARVDHIEYVNEALREIGGFGKDAEITDLLQRAQATHIQEVGFALVSALEEHSKV